MADKNKYLLAAKAHYEAKKKEAIATLDTYFNKPVGIGEHSELLDEIRKWTEVLANAIDCLEALNKEFNEDGTTKHND